MSAAFFSPIPSCIICIVVVGIVLVLVALVVAGIQSLLLSHCIVVFFSCCCSCCCCCYCCRWCAVVVFFFVVVRHSSFVVIRLSPSSPSCCYNKRNEAINHNSFCSIRNNNVLIKEIIAGLFQPEWEQALWWCYQRLPSETPGCLCLVRPRTLQHAPRLGGPQGSKG